MSFFHRSFVSFSLVPVGAGVLVLAACSGKVLSLGSQSEAVSPSDVSGPVTACGTNAAHPNLCCTAGPDQEPSCVVYPDAPFTPCTSGATTYPDPRWCCPLDGSGSCTATSSDAGLVVTSSSGGAAGGGSSGSSSGGVGTGCANMCPPGWYVPSDAVGLECCQTTSGGTACAGGGTGGSSTTGSSCPVCPSGWQVPDGEPALCCMTEPTGIIECFSQAGTAQFSGVTPVVDAAAPPMFVGCGGSGGADGASFCGCEWSGNGHTYSLNCDATTCTCSVDGTPTSTGPGNLGSCSNPESQLAVACGF
jgi:hypothetical protein